MTRTLRTALFGLLAASMNGQTTTQYNCPSGEKFEIVMRADHAAGSDYVELRMARKAPLRLLRVPSDSGAKYSDGHTVLWRKGTEATIDSGELTVEGCHETPAASDELAGMFTYMADAAMFEECATGRRLPVAMEGGYLDLERAYTRQRSEPGSPLYVTVLGRVESRPKMEGPGRIPMLVVEKFVSVQKGHQCPDQAADLSGKWRLVSLSSDAVRLERPPFLEFRTQEGRVAGFAGCNLFGGPFTRRGAELSFGLLEATKMACPGASMTTEDRFLNVLNEVKRFRVRRSELELLGQGNEVLAWLVKE